MIRVLLCTLIVSVGFSRDSFISNSAFTKIEQRYGSRAKWRLEQLEKLMVSLKNKSDFEKVKGVNDFFNRPEIMRWDSDANIWNKNDYWATRMESLGRGAGDCEDFVIAKYFTLKELGVSTDKLYFTYVYANLGGSRQAHMVLSFFENRNSIPLILDNLTTRISIATSRKDLKPVYSFNADSLFLAKQQGLGQLVPNGNQKNKNWIALQNKMKKGDL